MTHRGQEVAFGAIGPLGLRHRPAQFGVGMRQLRRSLRYSRFQLRVRSRKRFLRMFHFRDVETYTVNEPWLPGLAANHLHLAAEPDRRPVARQNSKGGFER